MASPSDLKSYLRGLALLTWVATELVALTGLGVALGWYLHRRFGISRFTPVVFGVLGLTFAFWRIYRIHSKWEDPK
ncbi:MAG: hypothetical protein RJB38_1974 [Pseudomonadota bacterium]|jgi:F0F1-type ATP synthase assembly protein I